MYTVIKRLEISAAHSLRLSYPSKCENLHGHNWIITIHCRACELNADGMVTDFTHIKELVQGQFVTFQSHGRKHRPLDLRQGGALLSGGGAGVRRKYGHL